MAIISQHPWRLSDTPHHQVKTPRDGTDFTDVESAFEERSGSADNAPLRPSGDRGPDGSARRNRICFRARLNFANGQRKQIDSLDLVAHVEFTKDGSHALVSVWEDDGEVLVYDAKTLEIVNRLPMRKPSGKYNVWNKITFEEGTSH